MMYVMLRPCHVLCAGCMCQIMVTSISFHIDVVQNDKGIFHLHQNTANVTQWLFLGGFLFLSVQPVGVYFLRSRNQILGAPLKPLPQVFKGGAIKKGRKKKTPQRFADLFWPFCRFFKRCQKRGSTIFPDSNIEVFFLLEHWNIGTLDEDKS